MTNKQKQIAWLVNYINAQLQIDPVFFTIDAHNMKVEEAFYDEFDVSLTHKVWTSRIREAATIAGLTGARAYLADSNPSGGIPLYVMSYSRP